MFKKALLSSSLVFALALGGCASHPSTIVSAPSAQPSGISVSGEGEVEATPDVAILTLGVEVRAASAQDATTSLANQMSQVVAALKAGGVLDPDIQTAQLNVYLEHIPDMQLMIERSGGSLEKSTPERQPMHRASNTVTVKIRNLDKASELVTAALAAGANAVHGISFDVEDKAPFLAEARKKAVENAKKSASELAQLAGVELGTPRLISENASYAAPRMMSAKMEMADSSMPVERGTLTINHHVEITFDIAAGK